jgi:hypothetical protein
MSYPGICLVGLKETTEISVKITGVMSEIRTKDHPKNKKLRGFNPQANYTDRAIAAFRRS